MPVGEYWKQNISLVSSMTPFVIVMQKEQRKRYYLLKREWPPGNLQRALLYY